MNDNGSPDDIVAVLAIFGVFVVPVLGFVVFRYLSHRERMEMIRHGIPPGTRGRADWRDMAPPNPGFTPGPVASRRRKSCDDDFTAAGRYISLQKGLRLAFIGLALTIGLSFIGYHDNGIGPTWHPGPWLLGGLIPMFIGIAQVASAMIAGATFGIAPPQGPTPGAVPPPFNEPFTVPPAGAPPTYDSSYTYRPDGTRELRPPPYPPERR